MANPYHHALSSVRKWGGTAEDYMPIHKWFDATKDHFCDHRHRALRHHAFGIAECIAYFGETLTLSTGRVIPVRWVAEQHVKEDCGRIPTLADWLGQIVPQRWMGPTEKLEVEREE